MSGANLQGLHEFSQWVFAQFPVRKNKRQKQEFRAAVSRQLQGAGWAVHEEVSGAFPRSCNLVAGDVATAKLVLTAHYDTPARLPLPNFLTPRNLPLALLYQLGLALVILAVPTAVVYLLLFVLGLVLPGLVVPGIVLLLLLAAAMLFACFMLLAGPANPTNANDNTSGVLTLLEVAHALPPEQRHKVALVFFDNEELGLLGSAGLRRRYGRMPGKLVLNFDCVGDGDTLLFLLPAACRRDTALARCLAEAFPARGQKKALVDASPFTFYPSDQVHFTRGLAVAALRSAKGVGLYVGRIHTRRDTVLDGENLLFLRDGVARFAAML